MNLVRLLRLFLADLRSIDGGRLPLALGLSVLSALLEGMGTALLAPLLVASGLVGSHNGVPAWMAGIKFLSLELLLLLWLGCVIGVTLVAAWREMTIHALREAAACHWRVDLHAKVTAMEWQAFLEERSSDVVAAMTQSVSRVGYGLFALLGLVSRIVVICVQLTLAVLTSPLAALAAIAAGGLFLVTQGAGFRTIRSRGQASTISARAFHGMVAEHLGGMKLAKAHKAEAGFHNAFRRTVEQWRRDQLASLGALAWSKASGKVLMAVVLTVMVWLAVREAALSAPVLLVLVAIMARLLPAFSDAIHQAHVVAETIPAWDDLENLRCRLSCHPEPALAVAPSLCPKGDLTLSAVGFTWAGRSQPALSNISVIIPSNRTTALIGPSGGGKSTLADLCIGLLTPKMGEVRVGGRVLEGEARAAWRRQLAYVPQDVFLLHDTVRANLGWLAPDADDAALWRVLGEAALEPTIRAFPQGLDTIIGDRGIRLSGGERQRLSVARALLRQPRFLVLDEATSHLDHACEALLQRTLQSLHGTMTVLLIAHRLETVRHADNIVVIERGAIREQGTWDQLGNIPEGWLSGRGNGGGVVL